MSRKNGSVNSVDKKLEAVSTTMTADKDPLHHIELELTGTLKQMFEEAKEEGFKGDFKSYIDSLSIDELKRVGASDGGLISLYKVNKRKP
tara:strand:+ start:42 stop:311 length:270 start_codon:yes stop_codon:yes gene_type:complete